MWRLGLVLVLLTSCFLKPKSASVVPPPAAPAPVVAKADESPSEALGAPQTLIDDTRLTTKAGTSFDAPASWTVQTSPTRAVLTAPEKDLHIYVLDIDAASADEAISRAWARIDPTMKRQVNVAHQIPPRRGWNERQAVVYMVSPNERRIVTAIALRHDSFWSALLLDGAQATFEKRMSQVSLIGQSLAPAGYVRESFKGLQYARLDAAAGQRIVDMIEEGRVAAGIPGVAIALVQDGVVVYSGGLGVRELGKPGPITDRTRFMIASNTKAMTTLMLAKLVDEKRFDWDTPVTKVDPAFALGSAETTQQVRVKHLICACTGMPRQDFEWLFEFAKSTPASVMKQLSTLTPTSRFGEVFQYSNFMASAAGYSAAANVYPKREQGAGYDELMRTRLFVPAGMTDTTFDFKKALAAEHAVPYGYDLDGNVAPARLDFDRAVIPMRPAGGAWSSLRDMTRYVQLELAKGALASGKRVVSDANTTARTVKQVAMGEDADYGMGLMMDHQYGVTVVHHGGDLAGYHSDMFWIPDAHVGGVILTNHDAGVLLRGPFMRRTLEVLYDGRDEAREDMLSAVARMKAQLVRQRPRFTLPPETTGLGTEYTSDALGPLRVRKSGEDVVFDVGEWRSRVASRHNDDGTLSLVTIDPGGAGFEFVVDARGLILRDGQYEYVFTPR